MNMNSPGTDTIMPLRQWIQQEIPRANDVMIAEHQSSATDIDVDASSLSLSDQIIRTKNQSLLRRTTVGYGIAELLTRARMLSSLNKKKRASTSTVAITPVTSSATSTSATAASRVCSIDNFVVLIASSTSTSESTSCLQTAQNQSNNTTDTTHQETTTTTWNNILGVTMISPPLNAQITEPSFLSNLADDDDDDDDVQEDRISLGMYLEVDITPPFPVNMDMNMASNSDSDDSDEKDNCYCHEFGVLLYELYSGLSPSLVAEATPTKDVVQSDNNILSSADTTTTGKQHQVVSKEPMRKRSTVRYDKKKGKSYSTKQNQYTSLHELGFPSSICLLVQYLIDNKIGHVDGVGNDDNNDDDTTTYPSLEAASEDIHSLLCDPDCYLYDFIHDSAPPVVGGSVQPRISVGKVYGRENEVSLITDAFCRVSSGKSEAFFIGGYSGCGKTMLVQSLIARVNIAGGYVLMQKFDQMSKERPLLEVLAAFNNLCVMIESNSSPDELLSMGQKFLCEFENDFSVLSQLLPKIEAICPQLGDTFKLPMKEECIEQIHLAHNVHFTLQRFMRIVSSKKKPVVLFLDDCQWAGCPTLDLIYAILSDTKANCFFFVGSYRDNEVDEDHPVLDLYRNLDLCGVEATRMKLNGLSQDDLNAMIAESLCIFPRMCRPLSDIIFEKTAGNPFFALEFLRSLVDDRLLKYSYRERRWIWDEDNICSKNITNNVLYLLSSKMRTFPENVQLALKILSCFGIKTSESIYLLLSSTPKYPDFGSWLSVLLSERCIQKIDSDFKFVHDKVREAAYSLIPESEKNQFHYDLGLLLYSASKKHDLGQMFEIVDQINYGCGTVSIEPVMQLEVAKLNLHAGSAAIERSDFTTAYSYLTNALASLPEDHWRNSYDLSLRIYFLRGKAAYSCGNSEEAQDSLKHIIENGRCIKDTLDAHYYYLTILNACLKRSEAYIRCREVLSKLNETIPDSVDMKRMSGIVKQTEGLLTKMSNDSWFAMKEMERTSFKSILKFYAIMIEGCFFHKPELMPFLCCRMIHMTLEHGMCKDSVVGLVMYASILCQTSNKHIISAYKIGKVALSLLLKRYNAPGMVPRLYHQFYGFVAIHAEPLQSCIDMLRRGYKIGMSVGDNTVAFYNAISFIKFDLLCGKKLSTLLEETDYYLELTTRFDHKFCRTYLALWREVISTLIDKGVSTAPLSGMEFPAEESISSSPGYMRALYINRALQSFWLGYSQRCQHYLDKLLKMNPVGCHNLLIFTFYGTLNSFRGVKSKNGIGSQYSKLGKKYNDARKLLKTASELSTWNWLNKAHLIEAEHYSFEQKNDAAKAAYNAAISSSRSSKFIHEEGLAAELAALHCQKIGDYEEARTYFNQARECYAAWGSQMKVDFITQQLEKCNNTTR